MTTDEVIHYLNLLIVEKRVIPLQDLELFLSGLKKGKFTNPITRPTLNQIRTFHYEQFELIIQQSDALDLARIANEVHKLKASTETTEKEKANTQKITEELPYTAFDGAQFYQFEHPKLGLVYKILKPNGHVHQPKDWEKKIWPVYPLRKNGKVLLFKNEDPKFEIRLFDRSTVSKKTEARRACLELGPGIDLPTKEDYELLRSHFQKEYKGTWSQHDVFTEAAKLDFLKLFPDVSKDMHWTRTRNLGAQESGYIFYDWGKMTNAQVQLPGLANCVGDFVLNPKH